MITGLCKVILIVYGYPSNELFEQTEEGKVKLGGCCIDIEPIKNKDCKEFSLEWYSEESISFQNIIIGYRHYY
jgi:hypothetical protein